MLAKSNQRTMSGLTLIELLVALFIFGLISVVSFASLNQARIADRHVSQLAEQLKTLQLAVRKMDQDFSQMVIRKVRDESGDTVAAIAVSGQGDNLAIEFTRSGVDSQFNFNRTDLMRVAYYVEDKKLYRRVWHQLDRAGDTKSESYVILRQVESVAIVFYDDNAATYTRWPPNESGTLSLPRAVEIKIELKGAGTLTRLIEIKEVVP